MADYREDLNGKSQQEIVEYIKNSIQENCKNITFRFEEDKSNYNMRKPNENEVKMYMKWLLRGYHFDDPELVSTSTYYTFKGQIRRGNYDNLYLFLKGIGKLDQFKSKVDKYREIESILEHIVQVKFPEPIKMVSIDIQLDKEVN